ncbi:MAG: N-methyl-L-tryptophan oxidase [Usitatibacter sp.]
MTPTVQRRFDAIVVGLGAFGAATAYQLAKAGARVLGVDRFVPPHAHGSSHGDTRITRLAIGEGDAYVPLAIRSHEIWRELEAATGESLLTATGGLWISSGARRAETHVKGFFDNTLAAARRFGIRHEVLDAAAIRKGFPQFRVSSNESGYYEPGAGFVRPESCIRAQLRLAASHGAVLHTGEDVRAFEEQGGHVLVVTDRGRYEAGQVVVCAGAWITRLAGPDLARLFTLTRQVLYWFDVADNYRQFAIPRFPVWIWELQHTDRVIYGFPAIDGLTGGAKVATEQYGEALTPGEIEALEPVSDAQARAMHERLVAPNLPGLGRALIKAVPCIYTATPDFQFLIDRHPQMRRVILASPCSGHGFKHSAAVGEALAAMALGRESPHDVASFCLARFDRAGAGLI